VTLQVPGTAVLSDGREINFTARLDMLSKDLSSTISWENYYGHYIACGPWSIALYKNSGRANISHINQGYWGNLHAPQFGKPYEDEFGQIDPIVKTYQEGTKMIIEAEFASKKFPGMVVTQVYTLCASGIVTRANRIENRSGEVSHAVLLDSYGLGVEQYAVFSYKGKIVQNQANPTSAGIAWGVGPRDMAGIDENWVYQDSPNNPMGFIWPSDYKPLELMYSYISFEIDPGGLAQGQIFETKPVIYVHGMFSNYNDFRNYAMKINKKEAEIPVNMVELCINGYNPFVSAEAIKLEVTNNTAEDFAGELIVSAGNLIERQQQTNEPGDSPASNVFELPVKDATGYAEVINLKMNMLGYMKSFDRAIFFPKGDVSFIKDGTIHAVSNGRLTFRADPAYGSGCYSIIDVKGQEWLLHQHPNPHRTLGWQNPNMGGIVCFPPDMYHTAILKEKISAEFTNVTDNYGNIWQGICTTISINEEEALKGAALKSYYVTLPGLPMMCIFIKFENTTGEYKNIGMGVGAVFNIAEDHKDITIELCDKPGREYQFRMGSEANSSFENAITVKSKRAETLYMFHGNKIPGRYNSFHSNSKIQLGMDFWVSASAKDKETYTSSPVFLFLTEKDVPRDALDDLGRIRF
ncbi:MAG: hypothetical protein FWC32_01025, partial [Firmicutes bacterium]|nr:hypothetical protein [Bacillota bacterium]